MSELTGKLIVKNETKEYGFNGLKKIEFVIKTEDSKYPQEIQIELINDKCELLDNINIGDTIKISYNEIIETNKPKVLFAETVTGSSNSILVRQFAKDLCDKGFDIGQNRLFEWLRNKGYLNSENEPYQNYVSQGLFEVITRTIGSCNDTFTTKTTKITGKGQVYFTEKIKTYIN